MRAYAAQYSMEDFEVVALERKFEGKIANPKTGKSSRSLDIAGKIDGIVKVGPEFFLLEHKTASQIDSGTSRSCGLISRLSSTLFTQKRRSEYIFLVSLQCFAQSPTPARRGETEAEFEARRAELILKSKTGKSNAKAPAARNRRRVSGEIGKKIC